MKKMRIRYRKEKNSYFKRFLTLLKHPLFWLLTIVGNLMIVFGGLALFFLESHGEKSLELVDCLLWSTSIVTTVGYTSYVPQTFFGKLTVIVLMLLGTFFLWSYMAFLVSALISPALNSIEKEMQDVEKELNELKIEEHTMLNKL